MLLFSVDAHSEFGKSEDWDCSTLTDRLSKAKELRKCCKPARSVSKGIQKLKDYNISGHDFIHMNLPSFMDMGISQNVANAFIKMGSYFETVNI